MNDVTRQSIGVFDSGIGGLSVLAHIRARLPHEHLSYVADTAFMPYGNKSAAEVEARSLYIVDYLLGQGAKALVVACNTATAAAINSLREQVNVPVIGMEPAIKPAVHKSASGVVGVLATSGTISSEKFSRLMQQFTEHAELIVQPCPGLVECIEAGDLDSPYLRALLQQYLQPVMDKGADTLVLGCTHYPFVMPLIRDMVGGDVHIVDTGEAIARELERQLGIHGLLNLEAITGQCSFLSSGEVSATQAMVKKLWGEDGVIVRALRT